MATAPRLVRSWNQMSTNGQELALDGARSLATFRGMLPVSLDCLDCESLYLTMDFYKASERCSLGLFSLQYLAKDGNAWGRVAECQVVQRKTTARVDHCTLKDFFLPGRPELRQHRTAP
jgi:hypothetical protein